MNPSSLREAQERISQDLDFHDDPRRSKFDDSAVEVFDDELVFVAGNLWDEIYAVKSAYVLAQPATVRAV